jgi:hypothetical protein
LIRISCFGYILFASGGRLFSTGPSFNPSCRYISEHEFGGSSKELREDD